jgi:hypothetical protein
MVMKKEHVCSEMLQFQDTKDEIKKAVKILKYKDLSTEIQRMWNIKAKLIPVIIWATGTTSKSFKQYLSNTLGKYKIKEVQKKQPHWALHLYCGQY